MMLRDLTIVGQLRADFRLSRNPKWRLPRFPPKSRISRPANRMPNVQTAHNTTAIYGTAAN